MLAGIPQPAAQKLNNGTAGVCSLGAAGLGHGHPELRVRRSGSVRPCCNSQRAGPLPTRTEPVLLPEGSGEPCFQGLDCKYSPKQPFNKKSPGEKGTNNSSFSLPVNVLENDPAKLQQEGKRRSLQCLARKKDATLLRSKKMRSCCKGRGGPSREVVRGTSDHFQKTEST